MIMRTSTVIIDLNPRKKVWEIISKISTKCKDIQEPTLNLDGTSGTLILGTRGH